MDDMGRSGLERELQHRQDRIDSMIQDGFRDMAVRLQNLATAQSELRAEMHARLSEIRPMCAVHEQRLNSFGRWQGYAVAIFLVATSGMLGAFISHVSGGSGP